MKERTIIVTPKEKEHEVERNENTIVIPYEDYEHGLRCFRAALRMKPDTIIFKQC